MASVHSGPSEAGEPVYRHLLESLPAVLCTLDPAGHVMFIAGGLEEFIGLRKEEVLGRKITEFLRPEDVQGVSDIIAYAATLEPGVAMGPLRVFYQHASGYWKVTEVWSVNRLDDPSIHGIECLLMFESAHTRFDDVLTSMAEGHPLDHTLPTLAGALSGYPVLSPSMFVEATPSGPLFHIPPESPHLPGPGLEGPWDEVLIKGITLEMADLSQLPEETRSAAERAGLTGVWTYPVFVALDHRLAAALVVWRTTTEQPTFNQLRHIERAVTIASLACGRRLTEQQLRDAAFSDPLTGVSNRRMLHSLASQHEAGQGGEAGQEIMALLYVDLDMFKDVNDKHGHIAGDAVLAEVARRISSAVRPSDHVVRVGGDEFAVVCTSLEGTAEAVAIAQRIIDHVGEPVIVGIGAKVTVGASVGIACAMSESATFNDLVHTADKALYTAKDRGRGRWSLISDGVSENPD
ncbi:MAG TPA: sensor domain-containing diguanylate cyclase [Acidimicrobiales bacterium]|nr:sensor domain-containing diguanylate cyclase [Acidimicrobiales bacterium]